MQKTKIDLSELSHAINETTSAIEDEGKIISGDRRTEMDEVDYDGTGDSHIRESAVFAGNQLANAYWGWNWIVDWKNDGCLFIKLAELLDFGQYGFLIHPKWTTHRQLRKAVLDAGGELLERCNMPRGAKPQNAEQRIIALEGAEQRFNRKNPTPLKPSQVILGS